MWSESTTIRGRRFFGADASTAPLRAKLERRASKLSPLRARPARRDWDRRSAAWSGSADRSGAARGRTAIAQLGRGSAEGGLRDQRGRDNGPAGSRLCPFSRSPVPVHELQQGLWRRPEPAAAGCRGRRATCCRRSILTPRNGIDETLSIDQCRHSLFGVSKVAADLMVQEYALRFGLTTMVFRAGVHNRAGASSGLGPRVSRLSVPASGRRPAVSGDWSWRLTGARQSARR